MFAKLRGWGQWEIIEDKKVKENRHYFDPDPYGGGEYIDWVFEGRIVTYKRMNHKTGLIQYKKEEYQLG